MRSAKNIPLKRVSARGVSSQLDTALSKVGEDNIQLLSAKLAPASHDLLGRGHSYCLSVETMVSSLRDNLEFLIRLSVYGRY